MTGDDAKVLEDLSSNVYHGKGGQPGRDLHLHVDRTGLDPFKGYGRNALDHACPLVQSRVAELRGESKNIRGTEMSAI
jgi:hypothetical protein